DFNNGTDGTAVRQYLFLTPRAGSTNFRYAITNNNPGGEFIVEGVSEAPFGAPAFLAMTYDSATTTGSLYVGQGTTLTLVGQSQIVVTDPTQLTGITNLWLGRSAFNTDPLFNGTIDQFDIFNEARTQPQVQADCLSGPRPLPQ